MIKEKLYLILNEKDDKKCSGRIVDEEGDTLLTKISYSNLISDLRISLTKDICDIDNYEIVDYLESKTPEQFKLKKNKNEVNIESNVKAILEMVQYMYDKNSELYHNCNSLMFSLEDVKQRNTYLVKYLMQMYSFGIPVNHNTKIKKNSPRLNSFKQIFVTELFEQLWINRIIPNTLYEIFKKNFKNFNFFTDNITNTIYDTLKEYSEKKGDKVNE